MIRCVALVLAMMLAGCFDDVTSDDLCHPSDPACAQVDSDGDGVKNADDDFPADEACAVISDENCMGCGLACKGNGICMAAMQCSCTGSWKSDCSVCVGAGCLSVGAKHTCALDSEGQAMCWGVDSRGQSSPPSGAFVSISAGDYHTCALDSEGQAACWGRDDYGQSSPPAGTFTAIAAGPLRTCALDTHGQAVCWGRNEDGSSPPEGEFVSISCSVGCCALHADGTPVCWGGGGGWGNLIAPEGTFSTVSVGGFGAACGLDPSGQVVCWGHTNSGYPPSPPEGVFIAVAVSGPRVCALDVEGRASCNSVTLESPPQGEFTAISISSYSSAGCVLDSQGQVVCWGDNQFGQATPPPNFPNP